MTDHRPTHRPQSERTSSSPIITLPKPRALALAIHAALLSLALGAAELTIQPAQAADAPVAAPTRKTYSLPPGPLEDALNRFARQAGVLLSFDPKLTDGIKSKGLNGSYSTEEGFAALLSGTGLTSRFTNDNTVTLERAVARPEQDGSSVSSSTASGAAVTTLPRVTVTAGRDTNFDVDDGFKAEFQTSATKTPLSLRETPQSVSVITQDSLEARQVQDLSQALETAAGVNVFSGTDPFGGVSPFGFDQTQIRGIALDGARDIREDGFVSSTFFFPTDLAIYERIDVVKGPSSTLYGRGSPGGFVNRIRKKPLSEFQFEIAPSIGSFDSYRLDADVTGPLFESEKVRGRLVAAYEDAGSFIDGVESERTLFAPSLELDLGDRTRLLLQGSYQEDEFIPNTGFALVEEGDRFRAPNVSRSLFFGVPNEDKNKWEFLTGTAQLEHDISDNWLATLRMNGSSQDTPIDQDSYVYGFATATEDFIPRVGDVNLFSSAYDIQRDVWSGEFQLQGNVTVFGRPANIALGLEHSDLEYSRSNAYVALGMANIYDDNFTDFLTADPNPGSTGFTDTKDTGVYGQFQFRPFERLSVLLGGRYDVSKSETLSVDTLTGALSSADEQEDKAFTGRVGLTFDVSQRLSVYGLCAQSFEPTAATDRTGNILEPETGEIWETGIKTDWLNGKLGVNAAIFRIDRDNTAIPGMGMVGEAPFSVSAGLQRSEGIELEINGEALPGWQLSFAGSLLDSDFIEQGDPFQGSQAGGAADWQVGLFTSYELQGGALKGLGAGVGVFAIGERGVSTFVPDATLDGYERVDLSLFYNGFENTRIALQVRNVFDEVYVAGADRTGAQAQFGSPPAVLLTVRHEFGK